jgi:hypothetical protein
MSKLKIKELEKSIGYRTNIFGQVLLDKNKMYEDTVSSLIPSSSVNPRSSVN